MQYAGAFLFYSRTDGAKGEERVKIRKSLSFKEF
jgi:hypothetical protein